MDKDNGGDPVQGPSKIVNPRPTKKVKLDANKKRDERIRNLVKEAQVISIGQLSMDYLDKCITIKGNVTRFEQIREVCTRLAFTCIKCEKEFTVPQLRGIFTEPASCVSPDCPRKLFEPSENSGLTRVVHQRKIKLQEDMSLDSIGNNSRTAGVIECNLPNFLLESCSAGDLLTVTGILKVIEIPGSLKKTAKHQFEFYLDVIAVKNEKRTQQASKEINFTRKDFAAFKEIQSYKEGLFRFLVHSIAPCIFGYELIKAGILLSLFGGKSSNSFRRNDLHMLIVGDPGMGKSQLLKTVKDVAPRGVYFAGGGSTVAGLTVTMVKEGDGHTLEPGALVMADEGVCCIDEFDKMSKPQHNALLEAMEQQSISIAKAGVFRSLPARSTVIAAANSTRGHYDMNKSVCENIKIPPPLLSRFDLIFILRDNPNKDMDSKMCEYLLEKEGIKSIRSKKFANVPEDKLPLVEKLKYKEGGDVTEIDPLPSELIRKYIAYAKKVQPKISDEAGQILKNYYLNLRSKHRTENSTPVTIRQFEALVRLSEARAKIELREIVTATDAKEILEIFEYGMFGVFEDDSAVNQLADISLPLDSNAAAAAVRVSSTVDANKLLAGIRSAAERLCKNIFSMDEIKNISFSIGIEDASRIRQLVDKLNVNGSLLKQGPQVYKVNSFM